MFRLLPVLLGLFGRNPKLLLIVAVLAAVWWFMGGKGCSGLSAEGGLSNVFSTGTLFDEKKYSATEIYEPLADNVRNPLPEKFSLLSYAPSRLNQGQQGSCVAWASAYAARTIMEARESGKDPNQVRFSPSFLYNQIALEDCQGAYLPEAMKVMEGKGLVPFEDFPYDETTCAKKPGSFELQKARDYTIDGYQRLTRGDDPKSVDMLAIKQNIARGAPVIIGMMVGGTFMQEMLGQEQWIPTDRDYDMPGFGGHAMCVIGYDDYAFSQQMGGFQIMNSWGEEWGRKGVAWVSYADFDHFVREAYGLYPMGDARATASTLLDLELGIVLNESDANVPVVATGSGQASTARPMKAREKFKLQVTNTIPCYVYLFGMETDGTTYTLFPYTEKHSPYCGITGTRLFPRDHSLFPDETGNADYFAVVVSKEPLDYKALDTQLDQAAGADYYGKLAAVLGVTDKLKTDGGTTLKLQHDFARADRFFAVIEVKK